MTSIDALIVCAETNEVSAIALTDHETIDGALALQRRLREIGSPIIAIIAAEYKTSFGDLLGLFLTEEIRDREPDAVLAAIRAQGGISVLPHPARSRFPSEPTLLQQLDGIEIYNGRLREEDNRIGARLCELHQKIPFVGPDAHWPSEFASCWMELPSLPTLTQDSVKRALLERNATPVINHAYRPRAANIYGSQYVKFLRQRRVSDTLSLTTQLIQKAVKRWLISSNRTFFT